MSIQHISQNELLTLGVSALPNRPSAPSLYSGRTLSATELKEAFDRLPKLIAERFNTLLASTGLFDSENPKDSFAELIATNLAPYHSLSDFFADVESGNLALYFSIDGKESLSDVLLQMKEDILSLQNRRFTVEGDGDLLTDITMDGPFITLQKGMKSADILAEAKAYTDAPAGTAEAGCFLPVSGDEVAKAITTRCAPEETNTRISRLEAASKGILYSYPTEDTAIDNVLIPLNTLTYGALCRLGGTLIPQKNLLSEKILSTHHGSNLSITWDEAESCLVFNGNFSPGESPVTLAVFGERAEYDYYHAAIFAKSGNKLKTGTGNIHMRFYTEDNKYISLNLSEENSINTGAILRTSSTKFNRITIEGTAGMQFDNYRCNILLQKGKCDTPVYAPFENELSPSPMPQSVSVKGANLWEGDYALTGLGCVTFLPQKQIPAGSYIVSFYADSDGSASDCYIHAHLENGTVIKEQLPKCMHEFVYFDFDSPLKEFKIYPEESEEASTPYTICVKDFQVELVIDEQSYASIFSPHYSHTHLLPASFSRYASQFWGYGNETCNYFDFEWGMFIKKLACYRLTEDLKFKIISKDDGRFLATTTLPSDLIAAQSYLPTSVLHAVEVEDEYDECVATSWVCIR